jgi:hypothetical protein
VVHIKLAVVLVLVLVDGLVECRNENKRERKALMDMSLNRAAATASSL